MNNLTTSVVIPAYNCEKTIAKAIEAILKQTYPVNKIIVVDDGSVDKTSSIVKSFPKVIYIYQNNSGPAVARNRGAFEAMSDVIFFTDSDCVPHDDWIEKSIKHFNDATVGVVAGSYGIANPQCLLARCIHKEIIFRHTQLMSTYIKVFGSYNVSIRRELFNQLKGFSPLYRNASGEDNDLSYKVIQGGYKIYFAKDSLVDHFHTTKILKYLKEQWRHGYWRVQMYQDHPQMMKGDDYTFWKDIVEVPLVLWTGFSFLIFFIWGADVLVLSFLIFIFLEIFYGMVMTKDFFEGIFYGFVMFFRSFYRSFGLSTGILKNLLVLPNKNIK